MTTRLTTMAAAIRDALAVALSADESVLCFGLGVDDPRGVFGTTLGLHKEFGEDRVFDMPTSENAMTGVAIGAALDGMRPVMTHQRLDFFLLALDQLVNNAAKWHYMFGGQASVPLTVRLILGRGWGQGPTHSQNLQAWFAHVPGLKVVVPATASDGKGLLLSSIFDDNPVVFLENRWLHGVEGHVPEGDHRVPLGKANVLRQGKDVSIVAMSYATIEAVHAAEALEQLGVSCEVVDLRTLKPLDWETVFASVEKTRRVLVLDTGATTGSFAGEIVARVAMEFWGRLDAAPRRLAMPDAPEPTSFGLTRGFYYGTREIVAQVVALVGRTVNEADLPPPRSPHDVPGDWFKGPF